MTGKALSAGSLCRHITSSLPRETSPQLHSATDAIAVACHAAMLAVGFRLIGLGEDHGIEAHSSSTAPTALPAEWINFHSFRYKHTQSSMEHLLKVSRLGNKTVIYGIATGDDKTTTFDITTNDYISQSALPATPAPAGANEQDVHHAILAIFISPSRLVDLASLLKLNVIQKLLPGLQKEGYEETSTSTTTSATRSSQQQRQDPLSRSPERPSYIPLRDDPPAPPPARPQPFADPLAAPPRRGGPIPDFAPPGFEDEHQMQRPGGWNPPGYGGGYGGGFPNIGERDLYPQGMGPNDPLRMGGVGGPGGLPRGGGGGGMHPTFDDPMFGGGGGGGQQGWDPRVPPGARYDPTGPGDGPMQGSGGRGIGGRFGGGGGGGAPPNPFGGFGSNDFI